MAMRVILISLSFLLCLFLYAQAATLFEDDFKGDLSQWDLIPGNGDIKIVKDDPPEHGPEVMEASVASGTNCLAYVKNLTFTDGFIEVLWKDMDWTKDSNMDSDGPIVFRDQNGDFNNCYLIELDQDTGLHIATITGGNENTPDNAKKPDVKSTDKWTWIKVRAEGFKFQIKVWDAAEKEPDEWTLEYEDQTKAWDSGRVGIRVWSGRAHIAFFRVSDLEGPSVAVEPNGKLAYTWAGLKTR